jgi:hypothetical protein
MQNSVDPVTGKITNNQMYVGPNIDYSTGSNEIGTGDPPNEIKLNNTDSLRINFVRYWPPADKVPSGLTKYLSAASWRDIAKSLPPRLAAYNQVKQDMEMIIDELEGSKWYYVPITVDDNEFYGLERVRNNLAAVMRVYEGIEPATGNVDKFNSFRQGGKMIITIDEAKSGRLFEAYFGFVPNGSGYSGTNYTYPLN